MQHKTHRLVMLFLIFDLLIALALLFLMPIFGVLWVLLSVFAWLVFSMIKPAVWQAEKARAQAAFGRFANRMNGAGASDFPDLGFTPEYELQFLSTDAGKRCLIDKEVFTIGRSKKCECRLDKSDTVGRAHCRIIFRKYSREYYIEDLRSLNGTYLGTRRLDPYTQEKLMDNSELTVGNYRLRFVKRQGR